MSQSSSAIESTWGKFTSQETAQTTIRELEAAGIERDKILLESENFDEPIKLEETEAIANLKTGAIAGAVLGGLIGLSLSLVSSNFASVGLSALQNFQPIHYFSPIMGAIVGAAGISLISGLGGASVPQDDVIRSESVRHLVVVKGTTEEVALSRKIMLQQGGKVEEADRR